jgi:hypothetical protein
LDLGALLHLQHSAGRVSVFFSLFRLAERGSDIETLDPSDIAYILTEHTASLLLPVHTAGLSLFSETRLRDRQSSCEFLDQQLENSVVRSAYAS